MKSAPSDENLTDEGCDDNFEWNADRRVPAVVPVNQISVPSGDTYPEDNSDYGKYFSYGKEEDIGEMSPMLVEAHSGVSSPVVVPHSLPCALDKNEHNGLDESYIEGDNLLQLDASSRIVRQPSDVKVHKKRSKWRSGVVVYPSEGNLTTEWKEDAIQANNVSMCSVWSHCNQSCESIQSSQIFSIKDNFFNSPAFSSRRASLTHVGSYTDITPSCSGSKQNDDLYNVHISISATPYIHHKVLNDLKNSPSIGSSLTDGGNVPFCKICHLPASIDDPLISPCRCSGTMQFIHCNCLMRWLAYSSKRTRRPPTCELCQYQYHWHKKFKVGRWQFPHCSYRDRLFHVTFFLALIVMIACATITILCFKQDEGVRIKQDNTKLTESEIVTLICGILFFIAFFLAMYVEVKARSNIYRLFLKFLYLNQQWYFDEYEKKDVHAVSV
ncbi:Uncharacterised protein g9915 [Pycnogonum litorale]